MTTPEPTPEPTTCCGLIPGAWLPGAGKPQPDACKLCPDSGRYWADSPEVRRRRAAADQD